MAMDAGTIMVIAAFGLAIAVFATASLARLATGSGSGSASRRVLPPSSSSPSPAINDEDGSFVPAGGNVPPVPYYEPGTTPPPLPSTPLSPMGWGRVSSAIYNVYDLPMMAFLVLVYAGLPVFVLLAGEMPETEVGLGEIVGTIGLQFFMAALVTGFVCWRKRPGEWLGLRWRQWPWVLLIAPGVVWITWMILVMLHFTGYNEWLQSEMGGDGEQEVVKAFGETNDPLMLSLLCFTAVVVAPITEEVLFRGYLYPAAKRFIGRWAAVIFSALVFAVAHANALALVPLFLLAVLLALAYELTGSLWAPMAIHTLFNGITVGLQLMAKWGLVQLPET